MEYNIVTLPGYRGVGLKWEGAYAEVSTLKETIYHMKDRAKELEEAVDRNLQLGLSYHLRPDGFTHYSVYEVNKSQQISAGMIEIIIPELTYLHVYHERGRDIGETYTQIYRWFKEISYIPYKDERKYYDELPVKHERYPADRDLSDPHFDILIPVVKR